MSVRIIDVKGMNNKGINVNWSRIKVSLKKIVEIMFCILWDKSNEIFCWFLLNVCDELN